MVSIALACKGFNTSLQIIFTWEETYRLNDKTIPVSRKRMILHILIAQVSKLYGVTSKGVPSMHVIQVTTEGLPFLEKLEVVGDNHQISIAPSNQVQAPQLADIIPVGVHHQPSDRKIQRELKRNIRRQNLYQIRISEETVYEIRGQLLEGVGQINYVGRLLDRAQDLKSAIY